MEKDALAPAWQVHYNTFTCQERLRLMRVHASAVKVFAAVTKGLNAARITGEFQEALRDADTARTASAEARTALENHMRTHGCAHVSRFSAQHDSDPRRGLFRVPVSQ